MILTPDTAIDPELWQWCPEGVSLHVTRLQVPGIERMDDALAQAALRDVTVVQAATRTLVDIEPEVIAFVCTSSSFHFGYAAEAAIRETMLAAGARRAVTTGGAVVAALRALGVRRVAVGAPYPAAIGERLRVFLTEAGFDVASLDSAPPGRLDLVSDAQIEAIAAAAYRPGVDALFLSCAALETRHLLLPLAARYGVPVVSSTQATMWAALGAVGLAPSGPEHPLHRVRPGAVGGAAEPPLVPV
jgi:maleate isomerase